MLKFFINCSLFLLVFVAGLSAQDLKQASEKQVFSPTEDVITTEFVPENIMMDDLLQMLANFMPYLKNSFQSLADGNANGESCGYFKGENSGGSNEQGVRHNADMAMVCAFLYKYGKETVKLPLGVSWADVQDMAQRSLVYAYSTHKANKLKLTTNNNYWGSTSPDDYVWESSLWAMSVAYAAFFQYQWLTDVQKQHVFNLIKAECDYELARTIPTGYKGDSKAEENGWETNILACALGLYPNHPLAEQWFNRLRAFAINCYSHVSDATNTSIIDPLYNSKTIKDYYVGKNLFDDYTLQNHNYFHTSYQNVVIQELGESALALNLFQTELHGEQVWKTNALMHNNQQVMDSVLNYLALADGELAMPNGNDWSLFLYDQLASYATMACFLRDSNALMLENRAYKQIKARQTTTPDGSWLLRPDVGARRMGVQAHRVMTTWLMHHIHTAQNLRPASWSGFQQKYQSAKLFRSQNIVRASTETRFAAFSWSEGLRSYTGYFAPQSADKNKIIVPYKANNTGNIIGWYNVAGKPVNAKPFVEPVYQLHGNSYSLTAALLANNAALTNHFALYATPGNAILYIDYVKANTDLTVTASRGGLLAISTDEFTRLQRSFYHSEGVLQADGSNTVYFPSSWVNIDNQIGIVTPQAASMAFADRANNNSILTSKLYPFYSNSSRQIRADSLVDARQLLYYSSINAAQTKAMAQQAHVLKNELPSGWNGLVAADPDGVRYVLISNFQGCDTATLEAMHFTEGAPVFPVETRISGAKSIVTFTLKQSHSFACPLRIYVSKGEVTAIQAQDSLSVFLTNNGRRSQKVTICIVGQSRCFHRTVRISAYSTQLYTLRGTKIRKQNC